nr:MAG TPA: CMT1A duplicated region transcript 4 protein [Caudoviricetes sp.]
MFLNCFLLSFLTLLQRYNKIIFQQNKNIRKL